MQILNCHLRYIATWVQTDRKPVQIEIDTRRISLAGTVVTI